MEGKGDSYYKLSGKILYPIDGIQKWLRESVVVTYQSEV